MIFIITVRTTQMAIYWGQIPLFWTKPFGTFGAAFFNPGFEMRRALSKSETLFLAFHGCLGHAEMRGDGDPKLPRITNIHQSWEVWDTLLFWGWRYWDVDFWMEFPSWQKTWRFHSQWLILCRICHRQLVSELILGQATWARAEHDEHDHWRMINDLPSGDGLFYHLMTNDDFGDGLILGCWPIDTQS